MVTARDDIPSKIGALDQGADDYITKPFNFDELLARIRALTRRADQAQAGKMTWNGLHVDLLQNTAHAVVFLGAGRDHESIVGFIGDDGYAGRAVIRERARQRRP